MTFYYFKFLVYINKHSKMHWLDLSKKYPLTKDETLEIIRYLSSNGYIRYIGDTNIESTYKGKHFIKSTILSFANVNIVNICALVLSIVSIIISIVAIVLK